MTRYALIDPLLRALGWDVSDPDIVIPEDAGTGFRIDYAMGGNMVVEAKKFGEQLDKHADQLIKYVKDSKVRYGVLTNGQRWRMYDSQETMSAVKAEFDVMASMVSSYKSPPPCTDLQYAKDSPPNRPNRKLRQTAGCQ